MRQSNGGPASWVSVSWFGKGGLTLVKFVPEIAISQGVYEFASGLKPAQQDHDLMRACRFLIGAMPLKRRGIPS